MASNERYIAVILRSYVVFDILYLYWLAGEKVILDTDMVELFNDGAAIMILANSNANNLLVVVTVSGKWVTEHMIRR